MITLTLEYFEGDWEVTRTIFDAISKDESSFVGTATFRRVDDSLIYEEVGVVRFPSYEGRATRRLKYAPTLEGTIDVTFLDGHHFIDVLATSSSRDTHYCGEDTYDITTLATAINQFEEHWKVRGPTKDYDALSIFRRLPRSAPRERESHSSRWPQPDEPR